MLSIIKQRGYLRDNIGPVLVYLPSGSTDVTTAPSRYMTQPSGIPILSPVLFVHVADPYIPLFEEFLSIHTHRSGYPGRETEVVTFGL